MKILALFFSIIFAYCGTGRLVAGDHEVQQHQDALKLNTSYLIDDGSLNDWDRALSAMISGRFVPLPEQGTNLGYHTESVWVAIDLRGQKLPKSLCCLEVHYPLDQVDMYVVRDSDLVSRVSAGNLSTTVDSQHFRWKNRVFDLDTQAVRDAVLLLKISSRTAIALDFSLYTTNDFVASLIPDALALGAFYGSLFLMLVFVALLLPFIRTKLLAYYLMYLASYLAIQMVMNGIPAIIGPDNGLTWIRVTPFLAPIVTMSLVLLTRQYFHEDFERPILRRWSNLFLASSVAVFIAATAFPYEHAIRIAMLQVVAIFSGLIMFGAVEAWRRQPNADLYFVSWLAFLAGGSCVILKTMQVLPSNFATNFSMQIGAWIQIVTLAFGVGRKFRLLKTKEMENERHLLRMNAEVSLAKEIKKNREDLAHDLRTPLAVLERILLGARDRASSNSTDRSDGMEALARMHSTIESLKVSDREMIVNPERSSINFATIISRISTANGHTIKYTGTPSIEAIVDKPQLDRVIENLVLNAIEAGASEIEVAAKVNGQELVIKVIDNGPGVPERFKDQLFKRGFTWNKPGGKGFGLDIVAKLVAGHRGTIEYQRINSQTRFIIRIPQAIVPPDDTNEAFESQESTSSNILRASDAQAVLLSLNNKTRQDLILAALAGYPIKIYLDSTKLFSRGVICTDRPEIIEKYLNRNIPILMDNGKDAPEKVARQIARRVRGQSSGEKVSTPPLVED